MKNQQIINKVGWLLTSSALGMVLSGIVHAGDVSKITKSNQYVVAQLTMATMISGRQLEAEDALRRGMKIIDTARSPREHVLAFEYFNYAANLGLAEAQFQCALMYLDDQFAPGDDDEAISLLEKASEQGHKQARIALNYVIYAGDGGFGC